MAVKAIGQRGSWFIKVAGVSLPAIHGDLYKRDKKTGVFYYFDEGVKPSLELFPLKTVRYPL